MKRFCIALAFVAAASSAAMAQSDAVFDENTVATYRITMNPAEWDMIVNDPSGTGVTWKRCTFEWQGETITDVAIRASRTYNPGAVKPTVRFKFDEFVVDRRWRDLDALKLDSMVGNTDPTMMRERLAMWMHRQMGLIAPRSCHGRLYVNGDFKGLYEVLEPVRKELIRARLGFPNPDGNLYEVDLFDDQGNVHPPPFDHYAWRGTDPATYVPSIFHPQTNAVGGDYRDIVAMIQAFNAPAGQQRAALDPVVNLDAFYGFLACIMAGSNFDSLPQWFAEPNNHYWYHREDTGKLEIVTWDQDTSFVNEDLNWAGIPSSKDMSIWYQFGTTAATAWIPGDATATQAYYAKLRQILNGPFTTIQARIDFIANQIRSHVDADPNKVMTLATFDAMVADLRNNWIPGRIASLNAQLPANTGTNNAQFIGQTVPATMTAGQTYTVSVTMRNTGTTTWTDGATYHLRSQNPTFNSTWGVDRATLSGSDAIGPGQDKTFTWTVTAPATPGTYDFQWQMRQSSANAFFGDLTTNVAVVVDAVPPPPPPPTTNNAQFVAQTVPATMVAGQTYTVSVTMTNNGTSTWTDAGTYHLRSQNPSFNTTWGVDRATLDAGESITPGQTKVFTWTVTAPATPGTYNFQFQMRQSSASAFFGDLTPNVAVVVDSAPPPPTTNNAQFVSQTVPATMIAGQNYTVSVTMSNNGTSTWTDAGTYHLRSQNPSFNTTWGVDRATLAAGDSITPGQTKVFTWTVTAPATPGTYNFQFQMRQSSASAFFGDLTPNVAVVIDTTPPPPPPMTNNAQFIAQTVPAAMTAGQNYTVSVTMSNNGTTTWTDAATYHLRSQNPSFNTTWGVDRATLAAGDSIAPGQQKVFTWTVTAPATPGTYNFQFQMRQSSAGAFFGDLTPNVAVVVSTTPPPPPPPTTNNAQFISQTVPLTMTAGATSTVSVTMRNTGTTTWTDTETYHLRSQNPPKNFTWTVDRASLAPGDAIAPGQDKVFTWTVTAPAAAGTYDFQWQMRQSSTDAWFGDLTPNVVVTVTIATLGNASQFVDQSVPTTMIAGQTYPVTVTYRNTGSTTWTEAAGYRLASQNPQDNVTWGMNRVPLAAGASIPPGQNAVYTWTATAPATPGTYDFQWQMRQSGVEFFGPPTPNIVVTVSTQPPPTPVNDAAFVSQNAPTALDTGETVAVSVTMRNTGTTTWTEATSYRLSSRGPRDNTTWGFNRAYLAPGASVAPGQTATFDFFINAPSVAGNYPFSWSMVQDGVDWFGEVSPSVTITVTAPVGPAPSGGGGSDNTHAWQKCGGSIALGRTPNPLILVLAVALVVALSWRKRLG